MAPIISLRLATEADSELLYRWRNHPDIRSVSRDSSVIDRGQHYSWVQAVISDPFRCLLIGISGEQEIGAIRFDISSCEAEISLYLAPELKGKGLGHELLSQGELWLRKQYPEISAITAQVLSDNQASRNLFIDHGYTLNTLRFNKGLTQ